MEVGVGNLKRVGAVAEHIELCLARRLQDYEVVRAAEPLLVLRGVAIHELT